MFDLGRVADLRVLVVGDVMLDRYWFGDVGRISPEAPVPVVSVGRREERAGGAANVASNVVALGAHCTLLSVIGADDSGRELAQILERAGIACRLKIDDTADTTVKLRVMSQNQQLIRLDFECAPDHEVLSNCLRDFDELLAEADIVVLSDYGKGGLAHIQQMIARSREAAVPVMVDPKGRDYQRYRGATMLTPNRREFEEQVGECDSETELAARAVSLLQDLDVETLLVTRSEQGMSLYQSDGQNFHDPAMAREVYDVTGAGDTAIAVMAAVSAAGATPQDALAIANAAAGIVVGKLGTASVTMREIQSALDGRPAS